MMDNCDIINSEEHNNDVYCRLCASHSTRKSLFSIFGSDGELWKIAEKIGRCLPIIVFPSDALPQSICTDCLKSLNISYELIIKSENSQKLLKEMFGFSMENQTINKEKNTSEEVSDCTVSFEINEDRQDNCQLKNMLKTDPPSQDGRKEEITLKVHLIDVDAVIKGTNNYLESFSLNGPATCDLCQQSFEDMELFDEHVLQHRSSTDLPWLCRLCDNSFGSNEELNEHKQQVHSEELLSCGKCQSNKENFQHNICEENELEHYFQDQLQTDSVQTEQNISVTEKEETLVGENLPTMKCVTCHKEFTNEIFYKRHRYIHDPKYWDRFKCQICEKPFRDATTLTNHMQLHGGSKSNVCDICGRSYNRYANMLKHRKLHKPISQWEHKCPNCNVCFERLKELMMHINSAHSNANDTNAGKWICRYCGKRISTRLSLEDHERIHTGVKPYVCEWCGCKFRSRPNLLQHHLTHTGERKHACKICGKRFSRKSFISQHMRVHTGEKPFVCDICEARFTQAGDMRRHRRRHTEVGSSQRLKLFVCKICGMKFSKSDDLTVHYNSHTRESDIKKVFECNACGLNWASMEELRAHNSSHLCVEVQNDSGDESIFLECDLCGMKFSDTEKLSDHRHRHTSTKQMFCENLNINSNHLEANLTKGLSLKIEKSESDDEIIF